jgi:hypothetical protein
MHRGLTSALGTAARRLGTGLGASMERVSNQSSETSVTTVSSVRDPASVLDRQRRSPEIHSLRLKGIVLKYLLDLLQDVRG